MENLRHLKKEELLALFEELKEPKYRAEQVFDWIWKKNVGSIEEMSNLPKELREKLHQKFNIPKAKILHSQYSSDGTVKSSFILNDNRIIEGVLIPKKDRVTACVSSQVGCSLSCKFCATGLMARSRNLLYDEIVDEVMLLNQLSIKTFDRRLSNIVFMGMGEPLLNYRNVKLAIEKITSESGMGMSPRRITLSTSGISKMIKQLADDGLKVNLAVSLHAGNNKTRSAIMPINDSNNIQSLIESLNYYYKIVKRKISFEYILFKDINDSDQDAMELVKIYRQVPADLVNIIEYNFVEGVNFEKADDERTEYFMNILSRNNVNARLRKSRGKDIDAACGQLANKENKNIQ